MSKKPTQPLPKHCVAFRQFRELLGYSTQAALAHRLGVSPQVIRDLERKTKASAYLAERLAQLLKISVDNVNLFTSALQTGDYATLVRFAKAFSPEASQPTAVWLTVSTSGGDPLTTLYPALVSEPVGRQAELTAIAQAFTRRPWVVLTGLSGAGKTTLAAAFARQQARLDGSRVLWVRVSECDGYQLRAALRRALLLDDQADDAQIRDGLRGARLIVFDDFRLVGQDFTEALLSVIKCTPQDTPLLFTALYMPRRTASPGLLNIAEIMVDDLNDESALQYLRQCIGDQTPDQDIQARQLVQKYGGHPGYLELIGGALSSGVAPSSLLTAPPGSSDQRPHLIAYLVDTLSRPQQEVLIAFVALFASRVPLNLLEHFLDETWAYPDTRKKLGEELEKLAQRRLVRIVQPSADILDSARAYCQLPSIVFDYVWHHLYDRASRDHAVDVCIAFIEDRFKRFSAAEAVGMIRLAQDNLVGAAVYLADRQKQHDIYWGKLVTLLDKLVTHNYFDMQGYPLAIAEPLRIAARWVELRAQESAAQRERAHALAHTLWVKRGNGCALHWYHRAGMLEQAREAYQKALTFAPNNARRAICASLLATVYIRLQQRAEADASFEQARRYADAAQDVAALAQVYEHRGHAEAQVGQHDQARRYFAESLEIAQQIRDETPRLYRQAFALLNLCGAAQRIAETQAVTGEAARGLFREAYADAQRAYDIALRLDDLKLRAYAASELGTCAHGAGQPTEAQRWLNLALRLFIAISDEARAANRRRFMQEHGYTLSDTED